MKKIEDFPQKNIPDSSFFFTAAAPVQQQRAERLTELFKITVLTTIPIYILKRNLKKGRRAK